MTARRYSVLGWVVWKLGRPLVRRKLRSRCRRIAAIAAIAVVILAGIALARSEARDRD